MKIEQRTGAAPAKKPTGNGGNGSNGNPKKLIVIIAIVVVAIALIIAGIFLMKNLGGKGETSSSSEPISSDAGTSSETVEEPVASEPDEFDPELGILAKFTEQYKSNKDFIGHISIPNTLLDSEVAKAPPTDTKNAYYLNHNMKKEVDPYGIPYVDYRADIAMGFQSPIVTIYGHNSKNGDYFESVKDYKDIEYYKANPLIQFDTIYGSSTYKIIGRFTLNVFFDKLGNDFYFPYHDYVNTDEAKFKEYLKSLDKVNYYDSGIDVEWGDQLLVLSTCNDEIQGPSNTPYRDVLVARKVRPGESTSVDVSKIQPNKDMLIPAGWQKKFGKENPYK